MDIDGAAGEDSGSETVIEKTYIPSRVCKTSYNTANRNADIKGAGAEGWEGNEGHIIRTRGKGVPVIS